MKLILCGMPGSGKSHLGKNIALQWGWDFFDTDLLVEKKTGKTCRTLFLSEGEAAFRKYENEVLQALPTYSKAVIATGGGMLSDPKNIQLLRKLGKLIYLKTDLAVLCRRLAAKSELPSYIDPLRPEGSFKELFEKRIPLYEQCDVTIDLQTIAESDLFIKLKLIFDGFI